MAKNDYWEVDSQRKKRAKKKKKKKLGIGASTLIFISVIVLFLAGGIVGLSYFAPDVADTIAPVKYVKDNFVTPTSTMATTTTTKPSMVVKTTKMMDYIDHAEFEMKSGNEGNFVGNILNGGKVGFDAYVTYHIVDGKGIYRFDPYTEGYTRLVESKANLSSLNLRGGYIYYVNDDEHKLMRRSKDKDDAFPIVENVRIAYIYDDTIYYLTLDNRICSMNLEKLKPHTIYVAEDELGFVGISKSRVFVTIKNFDGSMSYRTIDMKDENDVAPFRSDSAKDEILYMTMENGFMYYYQRQNDSSYDLIRQKFGSDKTVTLVEDAKHLAPVVVDRNRVYFGAVDGDRFRLRELNMNSSDVKTMLSSSAPRENEKISYFHSDEYDFIIGAGEYRGSSNLTSASNVMKFKNGEWKY